MKKLTERNIELRVLHILICRLCEEHKEDFSDPADKLIAKLVYKTINKIKYNIKKSDYIKINKALLASSDRLVGKTVEAEYFIRISLIILLKENFSLVVGLRKHKIIQDLLNIDYEKENKELFKDINEIISLTFREKSKNKFKINKGLNNE